MTASGQMSDNQDDYHNPNPQEGDNNLTNYPKLATVHGRNEES